MNLWLRFVSISFFTPFHQFLRNETETKRSGTNEPDSGKIILFPKGPFVEKTITWGKSSGLDIFMRPK